MSHTPHTTTSCRPSLTLTCSTTLVVVLLPLLIYFLPLLGGHSTLAVSLAALLFLFKTLLDWQSALRQQGRPRPGVSPSLRTSRISPSVGRCSLCHRQAAVQSLHEQGHRLVICSRCAQCLARTSTQA